VIYLTIIACTGLLVTGGLLMYTIRALIRQSHDCMDRQQARDLRDLTGHQLATDQPRPHSKPRESKPEPKRPPPEPGLSEVEMETLRVTSSTDFEAMP
jgi:hypothetical protein